jgi:tetratricopeptide (TPR) repeat protein
MTLPRFAAFVLLTACHDVSGPSSERTTAHRLAVVGQEVAETTPADEIWAEGELRRIANEVREAMGRSPHAAPTLVLNETIFGTLGFVREVDDTDLGFVLLPSVLRRRRGSCVGLGTVYLALGETLKLPIEGVMRPGHFYVRVREADRLRNVELLRKGEDMPDAWYENRFPIPGGNADEYGRALLPEEVISIVEYNVGNERRRQGRLADARRAYERAASHFPGFAEAQASLGTTLHLLGELGPAQARYQAAMRANPHLPGLDRNIELLQRETAGDR